MVTVLIQKRVLLIHKDILVRSITQIQINVETLILTFSLPENDAVLVVVELTHHLNLLLMEFGSILTVQLEHGLLQQVSKVANGSKMIKPIWLVETVHKM